MDDLQLLRYSRHILLEKIGVEGQQLIRNAKVLVIGAGGLGASALLYLASAGVGQIRIVDDDIVDLTNLQRQIIHETASIGIPKVLSAANRITAINPEVQVIPEMVRASNAELKNWTAEADVVLDCSDNFATRFEINLQCVKQLTPLVSGAAVRFEGQIAVFDVLQPESPCYACAFPELPELEEMRCATMGVFAPLAGMVGSAQAAEALRIIIEKDLQRTSWVMHVINAWNLNWSSIALRRSMSCKTCSTLRN